MPAYTLILGNKTYSSWSLRGWLAARMAGIAFEEVVIPLRKPDTRARILEHSGAGKVPALLVDGARQEAEPGPGQRERQQEPPRRGPRATAALAPARRSSGRSPAGSSTS